LLIIISGADGTGKSTIVDGLSKHLSEEGDTRTFWLRFINFSSKIINMFGRLIGKSYVERHSWGKVGYHDYDGLIGYLYIYCCYVDHLIFYPIFLFRNRRSIGSTNIHHIYDRYLLDTMADLIVDTKKDQLVLDLFFNLVKRLQSRANLIIITCNEQTIVSRRPDIKDDKKFTLRLDAFSKISATFKIRILDTSSGSIEQNIESLK